MEAIFSPSEPVARGTPWDEVFEGYCDGGDEARERHGVEVRFTPDITRDFPPHIGEEEARRPVVVKPLEGADLVRPGFHVRRGLADALATVGHLRGLFDVGPDQAVQVGGQ